MGWTTDLLTGIAVYAATEIDGETVGDWDPTGVYTADQAAIFLVAIPPAPDRLITLTSYMEDEDGTGDVNVYVQARFRGTRNQPTTAFDLRDAFRDRFNGLDHVTFGGTYVTQMFATPGAVLGFDDNNRLELTSNYTLQARHETALRNG